MVFQGDCLLQLKEMAANSVDALVTDPPAGISFMGKSWDSDKGGRKEWITWMSDVMRECLRVLKPGAHGLVWAIPRTSHWTATALEDAGFEVRDVVTHLFGSGFPKSLNIGKLVKEFQGWGTALKPASEHWILIRKPCSEKTVAANVLKHGVGGLNIDASRVSTTETGKRDHKGKVYDDVAEGYQRPGSSYQHKTNWEMPAQGRFPANLLFSHNPDCVEVGVKKVKKPGGINPIRTKPHQTTSMSGTLDFNGRPEIDHYGSDGTETVAAFECTPGCAVAMLDAQSGVSSSPSTYKRNANGLNSNAYGKSMGELAGKESLNFGDSGGASRFFYCAKASKKDRGAGNSHPTIKSTKLMSYLINLITPPNGTLLDPFMGSGSTGVAALRDGFGFIGIESEADYITIAEKRMECVE